MEWGTTTIQIPKKPLLAARDVAVLLDVHEKTVRRWVEEGKFPPPKRIGGQERWTNIAIGVWLAWQDFAPNPVIGEETAPDGDDEDAPPPEPVSPRKGQKGT